MGEETYLGIASDLEANSGFNRIELKWKLNADPRINASIISWEGCETPIEVPISADRDVNDYISKDYRSFRREIYLFDNKQE